MNNLTEPADGTSVALRYVREEIATLRDSVHGELGKITNEIAGLGREMRAHMAEQGPRMAVIEQRVAETEKDIVNLHLQHEKDVADLRVQHERDIAIARDAKRTSWQVWLAIGLAVLSAVLAWLLPAIGKG